MYQTINLNYRRVLQLKNNHYALNSWNAVYYMTAVAICIIGLTASAAAQDGDFKPYGVESGIVEYTFTGGIEGTENIYFKDFGRREARYVDYVFTSFGNIEKREVVIIDGPDQYTFDLIEEKGAKQPYIILAKVRKSENPIDESLPGFEQYAQADGMKRVGSGEVLGKPTNMWEDRDGAEYHIWNGIPLKVTSYHDGEVAFVFEAQTIDIGADIPEEKLAFPEGIEIDE